MTQEMTDEAWYTTNLSADITMSKKDITNENLAGIHIGAQRHLELLNRVNSLDYFIVNRDMLTAEQRQHLVENPEYDTVTGKFKHETPDIS